MVVYAGVPSWCGVIGFENHFRADTREGTLMVKRTDLRPRVKFTGGGRGLAVHAGARLLADLADRVGLTAALSEAMAGVKVRARGHGRGRVLADAAVWAAGADPGFYVVDIAATLVESHSDKQGAAGTFKGGFGFHPLMDCLDATGERRLSALSQRGGSP